MPRVAKPKHDRRTTYLREWRKFRGKTQDDAAEYLGVDQSTISNAENGKTPYDQDLLERLSIFYGCEPADLLTIDPLRPDAPRLVYDRLRQAPKNVQDQAMAVLDALLKAG